LGRKQTYIAELGGTSLTAGTATLLTNRLRPGQSLCIQLVAFRSDSEKNGVANLGVLRGSTLTRYATVLMPNQSQTYNDDSEIWLESDAQLQIDFTHVGATCPIFAWVYGYLVDNH